jgi:hypothetical protein
MASTAQDVHESDSDLDSLTSTQSTSTRASGVLKSPQRLSARELVEKADSDTITLMAAGHSSADGPSAGGRPGTSRHSPRQMEGTSPRAGHNPSPGPRCRRGQATHTRHSALLSRAVPPHGGRTPGTQPGRRGNPDAQAPGRTSTSPGPTRPAARSRSGRADRLYQRKEKL